MAIFFGPYSPSMAQASVRGACGFVLVAYSSLTPKSGYVRVAGDPPATDEYAIQGARKPLKG
jgi:hypothetical protein